MLTLNFSKKLPQNIFKVLGLHGKMTSEEQAEVFK
jgi:hypothetical protein